MRGTERDGYAKDCYERDIATRCYVEYDVYVYIYIKERLHYAPICFYYCSSDFTIILVVDYSCIRIGTTAFTVAVQCKYGTI